MGILRQSLASIVVLLLLLLVTQSPCCYARLVHLPLVNVINNHPEPTTRMADELVAVSLRSGGGQGYHPPPTGNVPVFFKSPPPSPIPIKPPPPPISQ